MTRGSAVRGTWYDDRVSSQPTGAPPPNDSRPPPSDERASDVGIQRVTLPAITPEPVLSQRPSVVRLASGRSVVVTEAGGEERLEVRAASGDLVVAVRLTDAGPVFSMSGASIEIAASKRLSLRGETVELAARGDLTLDAGADLHERVAGAAIREIAGLDRTKAAEMEVDVHPGGISLRANDDVDIVGERVRLNSDDPPMPQSWEEHRARHALPVDSMGGGTSFDDSGGPPYDARAGEKPSSIVDLDVGSSELP